MDVEFVKAVSCGLLVILVVATFIQWTGSSTATLVAFCFCLVVAVVGGFLVGTLYQWNKSASVWVYCVWMVSILVLSFVPAYVLRHYVLPALSQAGLFKWPVLLTIGVSAFLVYRYAFFYRQYEWMLIQLNHGDIQRLSDRHFVGLVPHRSNTSTDSSQQMMRRFALYEPNRLRPDQYPNSAEMNSFKLLGLPSSLYAVYYVPASGKLYRAELNFPQQELEKLTAWRWLYPLYPYQKYHFLELLLSDDGQVAVYVANAQESKRIVFAQAQEVDPSTLTQLEAERLENIRTEQPEKELLLNPHNTLSYTFSVAHHMTGDRHNLTSVSAISYNGERYVLPKKYWNGKPLPGSFLPLACLRYLTYNAEGKLLEWIYSYPIEDLKSKLQEHAIYEGEPVSLLYSYHLRFDDNQKQHASTYEYINGEKHELEVKPALYRVDSPKK